MEITKKLEEELIKEKDYHYNRVTEIVEKHIKLDSDKLYKIVMYNKEHYLKFRDIRAEMLVFDTCDKEGKQIGYPFYINCYSLDKLQEV